MFWQGSSTKKNRNKNIIKSNQIYDLLFEDDNTFEGIIFPFYDIIY